jgi:phospholipid/cholesterol/gamma-HCH transport system substrate-binding protein
VQTNKTTTSGARPIASVGNEFRVGLMFVIGLALLVGVVVTLNRWGSQRNTYAITVRYRQAQGILTGAVVRVAGVEVGRVGSVALDEHTNEALVRIRINDGVILRHGDTYTIGVGGLVGERYIEVYPGDPHTPVMQSGDEVAGATTPDMNELFQGAGNLLAKLTTTADSLNTVIGDQNTQVALKQSLLNLQTTTANAASFSDALNQLARRNLGAMDVVVANLVGTSRDVRSMVHSIDETISGKTVKDIEVMGANLVLVSNRLDNMARVLDETISDPEIHTSLLASAKNLRQTSADLGLVMANAKDASRELPVIAGNLSKASSDIPGITGPFKQIAPETAENLRVISARLRGITETLDGVTGRIASAGAKYADSSITPEVRVTALPNGKTHTRADLNLDIRTGQDMYRLGVADVGNKSRLNLQMGNKLDSRTWLRYGIVEGKVGVGADHRLGKDVTLTGELYDPETVTANALVDFRLKQLGAGWTGTTGWYGLFRDPNFAVGVTYRPGGK